MQSKARTNTCMLEILQLFQVNCKPMTDDDQSRLAIQLANCHFLKSGKPIFICSSNMSILNCTQNMSGDSWNTYTEFYTHASIFRIYFDVESICFYMQSENWQKTTEDTINALTDISKTLAKDLYMLRLIKFIENRK